MYGLVRRRSIWQHLIECNNDFTSKQKCIDFSSSLKQIVEFSFQHNQAMGSVNYYAMEPVWINIKVKDVAHTWKQQVFGKCGFSDSVRPH